MKRKRVLAVLMSLAIVFSSNVYGAEVEKNVCDIEESEVIEENSEVILEETDELLSGVSSVANPKIHADGTIEWDCIEFGLYPQAEIVKSKKDYSAIGKRYRFDGDVIENAGLFEKLEATEFDEDGYAKSVSYGDETYSYKRLSGEEMYCGSKFEKSDDDYWCDFEYGDEHYHYFRCEPIKWLVLSKNGNDAFLLAQRSLDKQKYNKDHAATPAWDTSTMRSWLNGYGVSSNSCQEDYTNSSFMKNAFDDSECNAIIPTHLEAEADPDENTYGTDTEDKIFLLSKAELDSAFGYDPEILWNYSECAYSTTFLKAIGICWNTELMEVFDEIQDPICLGACAWGLRSPGGVSNAGIHFIKYVAYGGNVSSTVLDEGDVVAVRPALHLNLSSDVWKKAGTYSVVGVGADTVNPSKLVVRQKIQLSAENFGTSEEIAKYSVSPAKAASVSNKGILVAKQEGEVTVTAYKKLGKGKYEPVGNTLSLTIEKPKLDKRTLTYIDETYDANNLINNTNIYPTSWTSSKSTVATINSHTGKITAKKAGTTTITAYYGKGSTATKYTTKVYVKIPKLSVASCTLTAGKTKSVSVKNVSASTEVAWESDNPYVADVIGKGKIVAISEGEATIKAIINGIEYPCTVKVNSLPQGKHLIWFDANEGTCAKLNKVVTENKRIGKLPVPKMNGARFAGWYTEPIGGDEIKSSNLFEDYYDITLYAHWE